MVLCQQELSSCALACPSYPKHTSPAAAGFPVRSECTCWSQGSATGWPRVQQDLAYNWYARKDLETVQTVNKPLRLRPEVCEVNGKGKTWLFHLPPPF